MRSRASLGLYYQRMDEAIRRLADQAIQAQVFPGAVVAYAAAGRKTMLPFGQLTYATDSPAVTAGTVYDVASITKSIPVSSIILTLIERGQLALDDRVVQFIPKITAPEREDILIRHLLTYTVAFNLPQKLSAYARQGGTALLRALFAAPLQTPPGIVYCYSNAPAILLGLIAERILGQPLDVIANELFFDPLGMVSTTFHPERLNGAGIAPTETDWRGEVQGVVHDESAWALRNIGMVPGNAGLFSCAADLLTFGEMLLASGEFQGQRYFEPATVKQMHTNQIATIGGSTGLGWELGQPRFMGAAASVACFGKIGFTGATILIDPAKQTVLVLLCNRTYPHRPADGAAINQFRCALADAVLG